MQHLVQELLELHMEVCILSWLNYFQLKCLTNYTDVLYIILSKLISFDNKGDSYLW